MISPETADKIDKVLNKLAAIMFFASAGFLIVMAVRIMWRNW